MGVMDAIGRIVTARPVAVVVLIILLTAGFGAAISMIGMEQRMDEKDFTPDLKEARADTEISETFASSYGISVFVRASDKESDIITPENMTAVLELEKAIYNDTTVKEYLKTGTSADVSSVADLIAQVYILQAMQEEFQKMGEQMGAAIYQAVNATVDRYVAQGLNASDSALMKSMVIGYIMSHTTQTAGNASMAAAGIYMQKSHAIKDNVSARVGFTVTSSIRDILSSLNASYLATMDNASARAYINETVESAINSTVENATRMASYQLSMELMPAVNTSVYVEMGELAMNFGIGLGMAYGYVIGNKSAALAGDIMASISAITGQALPAGGQEGGQSIPSGMMDMINTTVTYATENFTAALTPRIVEAMNSTVASVVNDFSVALAGNLTGYLYGELAPMKEELYQARDNQTAMNSVVENYSSSIGGNASAWNASFNVLDYDMAAFSTPEPTGVSVSAIEDCWDTGVMPPLNATYKAFINGFRSFEMPARNDSSSGGMDSSALLKAFSAITYDDKIAVYMGGNVSLTFPGMPPLELSFQPMTDAALKETIKGYYLHPIKEMGFLTEAMNMSFTKEFNPPERIESVGLMVQVSLSEVLVDDDDKAREIEKRIDDLVEEKDDSYGELEMTTLGGHMINDEIMDYSNRSMAIIMPLALLAVIVILGIVYRDLVDLVISLTALIFAIIWVYGFGALMGFVSTPMLIAVPVLIIGLGIDFGIHVTMRYREELEETDMDIGKSMKRTLGSVGVALLLATFTTIVAFLSNALSPIKTLAEFGYMNAFGIVASFIIMTTFVPAVKVLRDRAREKKGKELLRLRKNSKDDEDVGIRVLDSALSFGAVASERHPWGVLAVALILTTAGFYSTLYIPTKFDFKDFLPEGVPISDELNYMLDEYQIEDIMGGDVKIYFRGDVASADTVRAMESSIDNMADDDYVVVDGGQAQVSSVLTLMEDYATYDTGGNDYNYNATFSRMYSEVFTNGRLAENATSEDIAGLYDWLYSNAYDAFNVYVHRDNTTGEYVSAIMKVSVDVGDDRAKIYKLRSELYDDIEPLQKCDDVDSVIVTSGPILTQLVLDSMNSSQLNSIVITLVASSVALAVVYYATERSAMLGIATVLPMIFCMSWMFGTMYILGINLNVMTITIASLTIGLGITYGIHVAHRFSEDLREMGDIEKAMRRTVVQVGTALFGAAATTIAGFGLLVFALLPPIQQFGGLTAMSILYSFLGSVFVLPSVLTIWARKKFGVPPQHEEEEASKDDDTREGGDEEQ